MGVGRWPCFQQFLVNKKEHLLTEALAANTIKMIRTLLPCLLVLSIFVLASGFDTNPEQDVESSQVLKETEEEYVLRKRREALPKKASQRPTRIKKNYLRKERGKAARAKKERGKVVQAKKERGKIAKPKRGNYLRKEKREVKQAKKERAKVAQEKKQRAKGAQAKKQRGKIEKT